MNSKLISLFCVLIISLNVNSLCWKRSYGRTAGVPLSSCRDGEEKDGLLCYPLCRDGYRGVGPVCWEHPCRPSYKDHGAICWRDTHIYGNGCKGGCKPGYKNDGCTCRRDVSSYPKKSYGRTAGKIMTCKNDEEKSGLLCYPKCRQQYYGVGPVCWQSCQNTDSADCGAFCAPTKQICDHVNAELIQAGIDLAALIGFGYNSTLPGDIYDNIFTNLCDL